MNENEEIEYPRFKPENGLNYYDGDFACIHAKFGDFRKCYNFPDGFREEYPNFCSEYEKYWECEKSIFVDPMHIVNYIEWYAIPCVLYSNFCDREFADFDAVREWIRREWKVEYDFDEGKYNFQEHSVDGHPKVDTGHGNESCAIDCIHKALPPHIKQIFPTVS